MSAKWKTYTAKDALAERKPREYLMRPMFKLPSLNVIYGMSGSHKTNIMIDLAVCVAGGIPWLSGRPDYKFDGYAVTQSPILWIDQDSGKDDLDERFGAMLRGHKLSDKTPIHYLSFPIPAFSAIRSDAVTRVLECAKDTKCKFIVFDNLGTTGGGKDENSHEMISVMSQFRVISQLTKSNITVIHHDPKHDLGGRKTPRGHSSIEAAVDLALFVERDQDVIKMTGTKVRGARFDPISAYWSWEHGTNSEDLQSARFFGLPTEENSDYLKARDVVINYLSQNGHEGNQGDLIEQGKKSKIGRPTMINTIQRMLEKRDIKEMIGARNSHIYTLQTKSNKNGEYKNKR